MRTFEYRSKDVRVLAELGAPHEVLDVEGWIRAEPALARVQEKVVGGLRLPGDETGDCFKFTGALRDLATARGVDFRYGVKIADLVVDGDKVSGVATDRGPVTGDAFIVALGAYSSLLLKPHRVHLPV